MITRVTDKNRIKILNTAMSRQVPVVIEAMLQQILYLTEEVKKLKRKNGK